MYNRAIPYVPKPSSGIEAPLAVTNRTEYFQELACGRTPDSEAPLLDQAAANVLDMSLANL